MADTPTITPSKLSTTTSSMNNVDKPGIHGAKSYHTSNKSYINIRVFNNHYFALADSGSPYTIVNKKIVPSEQMSNLDDSQDFNLSGATGSKLNILGTMICHITIENETFPCKTLVSENLCETFLIGSDFLTQHCCVLNFANLSFTINNTTVPLLKTSQNKKGPDRSKSMFQKLSESQLKQLLMPFNVTSGTKRTANGATTPRLEYFPQPLHCLKENLTSNAQHSFSMFARERVLFKLLTQMITI